jgi:hypothetical protein
MAVENEVFLQSLEPFHNLLALVTLLIGRNYEGDTF